MKRWSERQKNVSKNNTITILKQTRQSREAKVNCPSLTNTDILINKINQSKPIIQSIYDKVKKKENIYKQKIKESEQKYDKVNGMVKYYNQFTQSALKIISKITNINHTNNNDFRNDSPLLIRQYQSAGNLHQQKSPNYALNSILDQYRSRKNSIQIVPSISAYERLQNKIQNKENIATNGERDSILNKVRRLSKQIDEDLQNLKIAKSNSLLNIREKKPIQAIKSNDGKDKKAYFLQLQKRKLKIL